MSKLNIKGKVQYIPGPWGMQEPVKGATIKIIDKDPGGVDDVILTSTTNSLGKFSGTSEEWQDTKKIRYWEPLPFPGRWRTKAMPDPTDIMLLEIDIREGTNKFRGPFVFLGNNVEHPIVAPWGKPDYVQGKIEVNGELCKDGIDLQKKARAAFESGKSKVKISIRGPESLPFYPFAGKNLTQLKDLVDDILPGAKDMLYPNPTGAEELIAFALILLALGAAVSVSTIATAVAFSLVLGNFYGYCPKLKVINANSENPLPGIEYEYTKCS